jgi:transposase
MAGRKESAVAKKSSPAASKSPPSRRRFSDEFRQDAVQMLLDGHTAASVAERLGLSGPTILYRWKAQQLERSGPVAASLDERIRDLEAELLRVTRERDILKKALAIFGRNE